MNRTMYYLDIHRIHVSTTREDRIAMRKKLPRERRDQIMTKRLKNQHGKCYYCACAIGMDSHLDHRIPVYYGGKSNSGNLVASCRDCNLIKSTDQIEITNPYTIQDYEKLQEAYKKWQKRIEKNPKLKRYQPKRVRLYQIYRADLFKKVYMRTY